MVHIIIEHEAPQFLAAGPAPAITEVYMNSSVTNLANTIGGCALYPQVRRGKGDNLEFSKFCKELMETKLTDVVHKTTVDNVGEPVAAA